MTHPTCLTCRHRRDSECRRYPPRPRQWNRWPEVRRHHDWCGEHEPALSFTGASVASPVEADGEARRG